ncbi:MAG: hypothetical protein ACFCD0_21435 [Gemmataceae bacterium]
MTSELRENAVFGEICHTLFLQAIEIYKDMEIQAAQKSARMVQFYCRKYAGLCHFIAFLLQFLVGFLFVRPWLESCQRRVWGRCGEKSDRSSRKLQSSLVVFPPTVRRQNFNLGRIVHGLDVGRDFIV